MAITKQAIKDKIDWQEQVEGTEFSKFYFFARTKEHINHWKHELEQLKKEVKFSTSISSDHNVEVMVADVNKATGIQQMLTQFDLSPEDTLAIGDSDNDLPMLQFAGYSVANASERIKDVVDDITEFTCDEDGVYHYHKEKIGL